MIDSGIFMNHIIKILQSHLRISDKKIIIEFIANKNTKCGIIIHKIKPLHFQLKTYLKQLILNVVDIAGFYLLLKKL